MPDRSATSPAADAARCNLCGSRRFSVRFPDTRGNRGDRPGADALCCTSAGYGVHGRIVQCSECGFLYTHPQPGREEIEACYVAVEDPLYERERLGRELTFTRHLRFLETLTGPAGGRRLLDVGAYTGVFVEVARARGWEAVGLEPSMWAAGAANERGIPVTQGFLEDEPFDADSFDLITMWDVIEHLSDPAETLRQCRRVLRPGGWLVVHTMDADSLAARLLGRRWPWLMEMHLFYFGRRSLASMLRATGFETVTIKAQGRYQRLSYLGTRAEALFPWPGRLISSAIRRLKLGGIAIPINFGDLMTAFAQRKLSG